MNYYTGELKVFAFGRTPVNWLPCNGQSLSIAQYEALFSLIGTMYGGDGATTFKLPDLRGRTMLSQGQANGFNFLAGGAGGQETVVLSAMAIPAHTHMVQLAWSQGTGNAAAGASLSSRPTVPSIPIADMDCFAFETTPPADLVSLNRGTIGTAGDTAGHENHMPTLFMQICICTQGTFPTIS